MPTQNSMDRNVRDFSQESDLLSSTQGKTSRRSLPKSFNDIEFNEPIKRPRKRTTGPKVNYVKPLKKNKRTSTKKFEWSWGKLGWLSCGFLVIRLFFMESGILDYQGMNRTLERKADTLLLLRQENADITKEIHKIKTSPRYQKKLARDHLGVIAKDEYLVLFSKDSVTSF